VVSFLGLPYAAAPTGARRFAPPRPTSWQGERDARGFGPTAPQSATDLPGGLDLKAVVGPGWVRGEDYLAVNVWTPDPSASGLPVMVFLHGGAFTGGAARTTGRLLAARTHAAWVAFARDGDPGWPRYTTERPTVRRIDRQWRDTERADGPERAVWDGLR